jgi:hypothetical protein
VIRAHFQTSLNGMWASHPASTGGALRRPPLRLLWSLAEPQEPQNYVHVAHLL